MHRAWHRRAAIAVGQHHTDQPAGYRVAGRVAVVDVFNQRLHCLGRGSGIELDHQVSPVLAVKAHHDAADLHIGVTHRASARVKRHLARAGALVAHAELVLLRCILREVGSQAVVARDDRDRQAPTVQIGRVCIRYAD